jgi:hypothetical protein
VKTESKFKVFFVGIRARLAEAVLAFGALYSILNVSVYGDAFFLSMTGITVMISEIFLLYFLLDSRS